MCFNTFQVLYEAACVHSQTGYYHHKSIETGLYYDLLLVKRAQSSFFLCTCQFIILLISACPLSTSYSLCACAAAELTLFFLIREVGIHHYFEIFTKMVIYFLNTTTPLGYKRLQHKLTIVLFV